MIDSNIRSIFGLILIFLIVIIWVSSSFLVQVNIENFMFLISKFSFSIN